MTKRHVFSTIAAAAAVLATFTVLTGNNAAAQTQTVYGSIVGTVTDPSGAPVPGILVTVTNTGTNISESGKPDAQGFYRIEPLVPGTYRVSAVQSGFKKFVRGGLVLSAGRTMRLDIALEVGDINQSVEVVGETSLIETESPQVSTVLGWSDRKYLPTGNSDFFSAVALVPGAATGSPSFTVSFMGSRSTQYDYSIDGSTFRNPTGGHNPFVAAFIEHEQEVKTSYVNNNAEYSSVAAVNITSKSGGNQFHGSGVWYYTSGGLQSRDPFSPQSPSLVWHRYSSSIAGPVIRDRTFFFAAYSGERYYDRVLNIATVPTSLMRQGVFSEAGKAITDPRSGAPFPGNAIPANRISPVAKAFVDRFYPLPNFGGPAFQAGNYRTLISEAGSIMDDLNFRVDHRWSDKHATFTRYTYDKGNRGAFFTGSISTVGLRRGYRRDQNAVLSDTYSFTPALYNEATLGWSRDINVIHGSTFGPDVNKLLGLEGITVLDVPAIPTMNIAGFTIVRQQSFQEIPNEMYSFRDNLSWIRGRHRVKAGFVVMNNRASQYPFAVDDFYGNFSFSNTFASGYAMADFMLGLPQTIFRLNGRYFDRIYWRRNTWQGFVQDDIQLSRKLTLNVGLRYESHQPFFDKNRRSYNFDPAKGRIVVSDDRALALVSPTVRQGFGGSIVTASQAGYPARLIQTDGNNFGPRIGLAYRAASHWVVRAGYGIYYDFIAPLQGNLSPFTPSESFPPNQIVNGKALYEFPNAFASANPLPVGSLNLEATVPNLVMPYTEQWSVTVENEVRPGTAIRASYVGTRGLDGIYRRNINIPPASTIPFNQSRRPDPRFAAINLMENGTGHLYQALQWQFQHRSRGGFHFTSSWTWAKDMGDNQGAVDSIQNPYDRRADIGNTFFTPRHQFLGVFNWELPVGRGKRLGSNLGTALNYVLGGWQTSGIFQARTGHWLTPTYSGYDATGTGILNGRPDRLKDGNLSKDQRGAGGWFDAGAFALPGAPAGAPLTRPPGPIGRFGNSGVGIIQGPGMWQFDWSLVKGFPVIKEKLRLNLFLQATNIFNHPNLQDPSLNIASPSDVGRIFAVQRDFNSSTVGPRQMTIGMRMEF